MKGQPLALDIESIYQRFGPMVMRRCQKILRDEQLALDTMQDVFVQLLSHRERLDDRAMSSLLYRIATNLSLNRLRKAAHEVTTSKDDLLNRIAVLEDEPTSLAKMTLQRLFSGEKASTRVIAVYHLLDGLTLEEVAKEVGLSISGVRKRLRQLRKHLVELQGS